MYTNTDIKELRAFIKREESMNEKEYNLAIQKNLDADDLWKKLNEKDNDGNLIKSIKFEDVLPFILVGFYCYITNQVNERLQLIADKAPSDSKGGKKTSLATCFEKAGLKREDWFKKEVSYSMTENALLFYMDKDTLNIDQVELILRMVRERMNVHQRYRMEEDKEYFDHVLPRKSFGRWLSAQIALQRKMKVLAEKQ